MEGKLVCGGQLHTTCVTSSIRNQLFGFFAVGIQALLNKFSTPLLPIHPPTHEFKKCLKIPALLFLIFCPVTVNSAGC